MRTEVVHRLTEDQRGDLQDLYRSTYWAADREPDGVARMLEETDVIVGVVEAETGRLVAFARVLTDFVYRAFLEDVVVAESHRGEGLGREVVDAVLNHPDLAAVDSFTLGCRDDVVAFYRKWGFETADEGMVMMNLIR